MKNSNRHSFLLCFLFCLNPAFAELEQVDDTPPVFKAISKTYQVVQEKQNTSQHLKLVGMAKDLAKASCEANGSQIPAIQKDLNKFANSQGAQKIANTKSITIKVTFVDSNCSGKMSVQTDGTIHDTSF